MTKEYEKRKAVVKRWPMLEREVIMSGTSRARAVPKRSASKRARTATQAERESREEENTKGAAIRTTLAADAPSPGRPASLGKSGPKTKRQKRSG